MTTSKKIRVDVLENVFGATWMTKMINGDYENVLETADKSIVPFEKIGRSSNNGWPILKFILPSGKIAIADMGTCLMTIK